MNEIQGTNLSLEEMPELAHDKLTSSNLTKQSLVAFSAPRQDVLVV